MMILTSHALEHWQNQYYSLLLSKKSIVCIKYGTKALVLQPSDATDTEAMSAIVYQLVLNVKKLSTSVKISDTHTVSDYLPTSVRPQCSVPTLRVATWST